MKKKIKHRFTEEGLNDFHAFADSIVVSLARAQNLSPLFAEHANGLFSAKKLEKILHLSVEMRKSFPHLTPNEFRLPKKKGWENAYPKNT